MKLAELRREGLDGNVSQQRSSRMDRWREMTASAAAANHATVEIPDKLQSLVSKPNTVGFKSWVGDGGRCMFKSYQQSDDMLSI